MKRGELRALHVYMCTYEWLKHQMHMELGSFWAVYGKWEQFWVLWGFWEWDWKEANLRWRKGKKMDWKNGMNSPISQFQLIFTLGKIQMIWQSNNIWNFKYSSQHVRLFQNPIPELYQVKLSMYHSPYIIYAQACEGSPYFNLGWIKFRLKNLSSLPPKHSSSTDEEL